MKKLIILAMSLLLSVCPNLSVAADTSTESFSPDKQWVVKFDKAHNKLFAQKVDGSDVLFLSKTYEFTTFNNSLYTVRWSADSKHAGVTLYAKRTSSVILVDVTGEKIQGFVVNPLSKDFLDGKTGQVWEFVENQTPEMTGWAGDKMIIKETGACCKDGVVPNPAFYDTEYTVDFEGKRDVSKFTKS